MPRPLRPPDQFEHMTGRRKLSQRNLRILAARWLGQEPIYGRYLALDPGTISILGFERQERVLTI